MSKDLDSGDMIGHYSCIGGEVDGKHDCNSSDALAIYMHKGEEGETYFDGYCYSCSQHFNKQAVHESSLAPELGVGDGGIVKEKKTFVTKPKSPPLTIDQAKALIKQMGYVSHGYRGIKDEYNKFFGHLTQLDSSNNVVARYYPETVEGKLVGYKSRLHPKKFGYANHGVTGIKNELSGQVKFKGGGRYVLIAAGEEDKVASYQMLAESRSNTEYDPIHVVSPTTGEGSAAKQVAAQYDFFDQYENIIIGMDNDEVGLDAALKIAAVLPADKVKIATWSMKDPNSMLLAGKAKQFVREFYAAKEFVDTGIKSSANIMDDVKDVLLAEKIGLPKYMHRLETMMKRALTNGNRVVNLAGPTSCGKSTHVNAMIYKWIFEDGLKPLVISLEMTSGEYAVDLLSLHLQKNLDWFDEGMDAWAYLERDDVKLLYQDLFVDQFGEERFRLVDDRDGKIETLKHQIERGVKQYGCNLVVIDVATDALRFLPMDEQEKFMQWEKNFVKQGVNIINVMHCRKPSKDKDGKMIKATEFDILGSSTFAQSAHITIIINRDKMAECPIERNRTYVDMPKCRRGTTGEAGSWYYDFKTRQVHDYDDYMNGIVGDNVSTLIPEEVYISDIVDDNTGEVYSGKF
tara:strand:+ start:20891 stop:22777 length:1887 start_codon:yes stop_codon:yes gene_type:complete